tara:strand:- start:1656 stop:2777 length:1122 start_codon:yes stop_codon:yes gene_type:complete
MANSTLDGSLQRLPISVLTGFLGSGKTTALNHLIQQPSLSRTLVLINEFGEIGLDHDLVTHSTDEVVIEMASGCLCCTIRGDLAQTLREAPGRFARGGELWFDRVVIETTGLADPAPILHTLMSDSGVVPHYILDGVITTVDAVNGSDTLERQIESVKQAAMADRLIITKADILEDTESLHRLQDRLRDLNPAATQFIVENGKVDPGHLFDTGIYNPKSKTLDVQNWLNAEAHAEPQAHHHHQHDVNRHDERIKAVCLTIDEPIPSKELDHWLETIFRLRGADLLRTKGIINVAESEGPLIVHGVQHIFHPAITLDEWPSDDRRSRVVFITRDIDATDLCDSLKLLTGVNAQTLAHQTALSANRDISKIETGE